MIKKELKFNDKFIPLIIEGIKNITIRNSPRALGIYKVSDDIYIEVYGCVKVNIGYFNIDKFLSFDCLGMEAITTHKDFKRLGFENSELAFEYYRNYLNSTFAFAIFYRIIKN